MTKNWVETFQEKQISAEKFPEESFWEFLRGLGVGKVDLIKFFGGEDLRGRWLEGRRCGQSANSLRMREGRLSVKILRHK